MTGSGDDQLELRAQPKRRPPAVVTAVVAALVLGAGIAFCGVALGHSTSPSRTPKAARLDAATASGSTSGTITVTGSGTVQGTPTTVSFDIGVHTTADSATEALSENDSQVASLESTLSAHGVTKAGMQTSNLSVNENTSSSGTVTGFSVDDQLNVTMHGIDDAGNAIDAAANAVGNDIELYGISFSIANQSRLLATARGRAMQNARTEASQLAAGAGDTLGGIVRVTDQENASPDITYAGFGAANASATPLDAGKQPLSVEVTVVYSLKD